VIGVAEQLAVEPVLPDRVRLRQIHEPGNLRASQPLSPRCQRHEFS